MATYSVLEARNNLSRLLASVESGAEVTITRRGIPVARVVPAEPTADRGSGVVLAEWFASHPVPASSGRSSDEIEAFLRELRDARE